MQVRPSGAPAPTNANASTSPPSFPAFLALQTTKKWKCSIKVDMGRHGAMSLGCWLAAQKKEKEASIPTPSSWGPYSQTPATRHDAPSHGWSGVRSLNRRQVTPPGHTPHFSHVLVEAHAAVGMGAGHSQQRFEHTEPGWTSGSEDVDLATLRPPLARPGQQGQGPESCHPPARQLSGLPQLWPKPPSPPALPEDLPCIQVPPPWAPQHPTQGEDGSSQGPPLPVPPASPMLPWARARAVFGSAGREGELGGRGGQGGPQGGQGWEHATAQHGPYVDVPEQGVGEEEGGEWAGEEGDEEEGVGEGEQQCSGGMLLLEAGEQVLGAMLVVAEKAGEGEGEGGASVEDPLISQVPVLPLHAELHPLHTAQQSHFQPHGSPLPPYSPPHKASSAGTAAAAPPSHPTLRPASTPNYKEQLLAALRPKRRRSSSSSRALAPRGDPPASPPPRGGGEAGQGGDLSGSDTTSLVESPSQGRGVEADMEVKVECGWGGTGGGRGVGGEQSGQQQAAAYPTPLPAVSSRQEGGDASQEGLPTPHAPAGPPGVMAPWMSLLGVTPGLGALGVSPAKLARALQQQGYTLDHVLCWGEHVRGQLDLLTATAAVMGGQRAGQLAWGLEHQMGQELDLGQSLPQMDLMHTDLIYTEAHNKPYTTAVNTLLSIPLSHLTEAGRAMSKRFYSLARLLLGGQLLTAVSAGKSAAANATLLAPGLLRSARLRALALTTAIPWTGPTPPFPVTPKLSPPTQPPSACTDGVTYFTANGIPFTVNSCATCKDGKVGNRLCGWSIDCCSSSGFCGPTEEWCGANCIGGPCGQKITVPSNRLCGSGFRGNGQCTSGCCNERGFPVKRVNDRLPKARQRLHRAAEYRRGIDGRARNHAWALIFYTGC
ncbi:hypothetical protein QJQ45_012114 [Haematococcus lacustris]|nr:hypothetical protein QJQ45_012114 [Haematococcus lacustris]